MIKLIASDLDGTLLYKGKLSDNNYKAIKLLQANNIIFSIATGRNMDELKMLDLKDVKCPKVMVNGSLVVDENDNVVSLVNIKDDAFNKLCNVLNEYDIGYILYTKDKRYVLNKDIMMDSFKDRMDFFGKEFFENLCEVNSVDDIKEEFCKVEIMDNKRFSLLEEIKDKLNKIDGLSSTSSAINNIEVIAGECDKYKGISVLESKYKIKDDEVAIFGDSDNDLAMFENVKESYAMGNANEKIKSLAKYVTLDCKDDGFYKSVLDIIENNDENFSKNFLKSY